MKHKEHQLFLDIVHDLEINDKRSFLDCRTIEFKDLNGDLLSLLQYEIIDGKLVLTVEQPNVTV
jgi:hypothetical protein